MSRIHTPATVGEVPDASRAQLNAVAMSLGSVPNLFRLVAQSPAALRGFLALSGSFSGATLDAMTQERIAIAVAELNGCNYCMSAHTYLGRIVAKLDDAEITANRSGASNDIKANVAVRFATQIVRMRGHVSEEQLTAIKAAGYSNAEIVEIVLAVALHTFTNYLNEVAGTEIDFPLVAARSRVAGALI